MEQKAKYISVIIGTFGITNTVFARAGGGQDYAPVSSGSNGSSGGGMASGDGSLVTFIIFGVIIYTVFYFLKKKGIATNFQNPMSGNNSVNSVNNNPLLNNSVKRNIQKGNLSGALFSAAIGGVAGSIFSKLNSKMNNTGGSGVGGIDIQSEITKIKTTDPQFNEQVFKDKAETTFFKIQEGWERQSTDIMRPYVSDSVLQRFTNQITDLKSRGEKNVLENIVIGHSDITEIKTDSTFNYITTKIDASAADYTLNSQGQLIKGNKSMKGFTEYWTFLRTIGVKTNFDKQLKDNKCPNCGAALEVSATGKCNYCGAIITSGQFDWVLSEIRQV